MPNRLTKMVLVGTFLFCGTGATADTIRGTSAFGQSHPTAIYEYPEIDARLNEFTEGRWRLNDTPSGLVAPIEMSSALRDGVTDFGSLLIPYFPAEYKDSGLPSELSILGSNNLVFAAAVTEYIATCDDCQKEFVDGGQVFLGTNATPSYNILTTKPVRTAEDIKGLRIRTGAPLYARFVDYLGGEATQIPSSELFESLSQGVIDGTFSADHEIVANRLGDIVKYVTVVDEGVFNGAATATASNLLWQRMSEEDRAALARASQYGVVKGIFGFNEIAEQAKSIEGIEFIEMDETLTAAKNAFNSEHLQNAALLLSERGVADAQSKIARFSALIEKWEGLISPDMGYEEIAELRYQEIFSEMDLNKYGF